MPYLGRTPAGAAGNKITGDLKVTGVLSADSISNNIILDGTDGSSSNATDNVVMDGTDSDSTNAEDNLLYEEYTQDLVSLTNLASGTDGNIISYDAAGLPVAIATGTDGQALTSAGAGAQPAFETLSSGFTLSAEQATTSGSTITFGSIPAGTKMIIVNLFGVSTNGTGGCGVQLGDAGGLETSGYVGRATRASAAESPVNFGDYFEFTFLNAADEWYGQFILTLEDSSNFAWVCSFIVGRNVQDVWDGAGGKTLSAELTQVALFSDNTFDAGATSILYL